LLFYDRILSLCTKHLNPGGRLYFELNPVYADSIKEKAQASKLFMTAEIIKDLSGNYRFLKAIRNE
jgi:release factor glutamine methyltransferase